MTTPQSSLWLCKDPEAGTGLAYWRNSRETWGAEALSVSEKERGVGKCLGDHPVAVRPWLQQASVTGREEATSVSCQPSWHRSTQGLDVVISPLPNPEVLLVYFTDGETELMHPWAQTKGQQPVCP